MQEFEIIAKTFQGLEEVLAQEITELGAKNIKTGRRMVSFTGDQEMLYRANFCLRTAVRVLKPLKHFKAEDADQVYEAVKTIAWDEYLDLQTTFAVDAVVYSQEFRHSKFVAYKTKDAIVDYFREKEGKRPNISIANPDLKLNIHIADNDCTLSLDASGESLHPRGYRTASCEAPINEVLAAGLIKLSGWNFDTDFIDPFCGSGTILIEAALMARNIYPGIFRKSFGFEKWKDFDRELLDKIYNDDSQEREFAHRFYGYDINRPTLDGALENAKAAGVADLITFEQKDFRQFEKPAERAIIITNPPYGQRLTPPDLLGLYRAIGERLKHEFGGGDAWIISSKEELFDTIGLRPSVKIQVNNGPIDCEFRKYQLFEGRLDDFRAGGGKVKTEEERSYMTEKRRPKQHREDFKARISEEEDEDWSPEYALLRNKHREFDRIYNKRERKSREEYEAKGERHTTRRPERRSHKPNFDFANNGGDEARETREVRHFGPRPESLERPYQRREREGNEGFGGERRTFGSRRETGRSNKWAGSKRFDSDRPRNNARRTDNNRPGRRENRRGNKS